MTRKAVLLYICIALTLGAAAQAQTQTKPVMGPLQEYSATLTLFPLPPPVSIGPKTAEAPLFTYGFDERVRTEDWNPPFDFNDKSAGPGGSNQHEQLRLRTRLWAGLSSPHSEVQFNVRLLNEIKKAVYIDERFNDNEVVVDALNFKFNKTYIPGVTLSVGRQDWGKNDGFLFMDATGNDGSRTNYWNMVNVTYTHKKSQFEFIGAINPRQDHLFPIIHNQRVNLNEWDEQAAGVYYTDRNHKNTDIDAYYFLKKETNDYRAASNALFQPNKHINTVGGRILQRLPNGLSIKGEGALQWDALHANPAKALAATHYTAFGGYVTVTKQLTKVKGKPFFIGGYTVLTGSDKQADGVGFDPLFSRWPRYSELYTYSLVQEKGPNYISNDRIVTAEAGFTPLKAITLRTAFMQHQAFNEISHFNSKIFGTGTNRGENLQARGDIVLNKNWMGHILWERWWAGDFYAHQDPAYFFRAEVTYTFRDKINGPK